MGEKRINFQKIIKGIKRQGIRMSAKTDCLLVRGDFNTFFSDSSVTEYYWSSSGEWILKYGKCCLPSRRIRCQR